MIWNVLDAMFMPTGLYTTSTTERLISSTLKWKNSLNLTVQLYSSKTTTQRLTRNVSSFEATNSYVSDLVQFEFTVCSDSN